MTLTPPWGPLPWRRSLKLNATIKNPGSVRNGWDGPVAEWETDDWPNDYAPADSDPGRLYRHY